MSENPFNQPPSGTTEKFDLLALANYFDEQGNHEQAEKFRAQAKKAPELEKREREEKEAFFNQWEEKEREIEEKREKKEPFIPGPEDMVIEITPTMLAEAQKIREELGQIGQANPTTTSEGSPPPEGK